MGDKGDHNSRSNGLNNLSLEELISYLETSVITIRGYDYDNTKKQKKKNIALNAFITQDE